MVVISRSSQNNCNCGCRCEPADTSDVDLKIRGGWVLRSTEETHDKVVDLWIHTLLSYMMIGCGLVLQLAAAVNGADIDWFGSLTLDLLCTSSPSVLN